MKTFKIRVECDAGSDPFDGQWYPKCSEVLELRAETEREAYGLTSRYFTINPNGRIIRHFNEETGEELFGNF